MGMIIRRNCNSLRSNDFERTKDSSNNTRLPIFIKFEETVFNKCATLVTLDWPAHIRMKTSQHAHITYTTLMCDNLLSIHQPLTKMGFLSFAKLMIPAGFLGDAGGTATAGADLFELLLFIPFELLLF